MVDPFGLDVWDDLFDLENHQRSPRYNQLPNLFLDKKEGLKWYILATNNEKIVALGDISKTSKLINNTNYHVLNSQRWSLGVNDAWLKGVIESGALIELVSDPDKYKTTKIKRGPYKNTIVESVFAREIRMLQENGYKIERDKKNGKTYMKKDCK